MTTKPKLVPKKGITARQRLLHTFQIDYASELDDRRYFGTFTTKKLSISDVAALGVRKAQLNGGFHHDPEKPGAGVDSNTDNFNAMIAHLDIALVQTPPWWDLEEITDGELIARVFEEVVKHENTFLGRKRAADGDTGSDGTEQADSSSGLQKAGTGGVAGSLVHEEVSDALEP